MQQHFSRDIRLKRSIPNMPQSPDIGQDSGKGVSYFRISGQSLIRENCHNSKISNDIDMKPGPVTRTARKNTATSKEFGDDVIAKL